MKKIIVLGGSNSKASINKELAVYTANQLSDVTLEVVDLSGINMPIYGIDEETENGIPQAAKDFEAAIGNADGIVISLAEHNGAYSTAFKNLFDWTSRVNGKLWQEKPMLLMATSPGARGGQTALDIAAGRFPYMGGNIIGTFALPSFFDNFKEGAIVDAELNARHQALVAKLQEHI